MKASQHQKIGTLTGYSQMVLSVLAIQIKNEINTWLPRILLLLSRLNLFYTLF